MFLNTIHASEGSRKKARRVGRGIGCTKGKTCGKGHKGQKARSGGFHKVGFEGGQMPLQRRLPKRGFVSPTRGDTAEVRTASLNAVDAETVDILVLKQANLVPATAKTAKVILAGEVTRKVTVQGLLLTKGARAAIEAAGGKVAE